jgi:hypothetical protein
MISENKAHEFANEWVAAWNAHDIDRVMSHYDDNVEYFSAFVVKLTGNHSGMIQGKELVKEYLSKGLEAYPDLNFKLQRIFIGVASITIQYKSVNNLLAAEVFELNDKGLAIRVQCHYHQG